ncbi:MAG TPA: hypothetical protein VMU78_04555 [Methylocella sp.]|nr:hypothetical protein [Methylocella sp.]
MAEEAKSGEGGPDTKEAEALADALNHSAERVQTLWFSFLELCWKLGDGVKKAA